MVSQLLLSKQVPQKPPYTVDKIQFDCMSLFNCSTQCMIDDD